MKIKIIKIDKVLDKLIRRVGIRRVARESGISTAHIMYLLQGKRSASEKTANILYKTVNKVISEIIINPKNKENNA